MTEVFHTNKTLIALLMVSFTSYPLPVSTLFPFEETASPKQQREVKHIVSLGRFYEENIITSADGSITLSPQMYLYQMKSTVIVLSQSGTRFLDPELNNFLADKNEDDFRDEKQSVICGTSIWFYVITGAFGGLLVGLAISSNAEIGVFPQTTLIGAAIGLGVGTVIKSQCPKKNSGDDKNKLGQ